MTMYKLLLPHGKKEITIGMFYGNVTLQHGQIMPESDIVKMYPDFFYEMPEEPKSVIEEIIQEPIENKTPIEIVKPEQKKKAGRPKKSF